VKKLAEHHVRRALLTVVVISANELKAENTGNKIEEIPPSTNVTLPVPNPMRSIQKIFAVEHEAPAWQVAMEALILVVELGGPTMFARIGMMRALNRHVERVFDPSRKDPHWGRRKLKRDL
jgi:hypothetical protein